MNYATLRKFANSKHIDYRRFKKEIKKLNWKQRTKVYYDIFVSLAHTIQEQTNRGRA